MHEHIWATSSRISVSGPSGWAPVERLEVAHASGRAVVRVERFPALPDADIDALADMHADRLAADGSTISGAAPHEVLGSADGLVGPSPGPTTPAASRPSWTMPSTAVDWLSSPP